MPLFPVFSFRLLQSELFNVEKVTFYCDVRAQLSSYKKASNSSLEITYLMVNIGFYKLFIEIYTGNSFKLEDNTCTVRI